MKTVVIVVHGVGDPLPGDALTKLVQGLSKSRDKARIRQDGPFSVEYRHAPLENEEEGKNSVTTFPVTTVNMRVRDDVSDPSWSDDLYLCEVYWGDLSRVKASALALAYALFDLIFGLRHIVNAARKELSGFGRTAGNAASAALWTARGPMFALNILAAMVCCVYAVLVGVGWKESTFFGVSSPQVAPILGSVFVGYAGCKLVKRLEKLQWTPDTAKWMMSLAVCSLIAIGFLWQKLADGLHSYINVITLVMTVGAMLMAALAVFAMIFVLFARIWPGRLIGRQTYGPLSVTSFCTALSISLFVLVVIAFWLLIAKGLTPSAEARFGNFEKCLAVHRGLIENCLNLTKLDPVATLASRIEGGVHLLPLVLFSFAAAALVFLSVMHTNSRMNSDDDEFNRERYRYIVNPAVVGVLVGFSVIYAVVFFCLGYFLIKEVDPQYAAVTELHKSFDTKQWVGVPSYVVKGISFLPDPAKCFREYLNLFVTFVETYKTLAITFVGLVVTFLVWTRTHFLLALDLILDVIAHFRTGDSGNNQFRVWRIMVERFRLVVEDTIQRTSANRVVILSHSQGTAIALHGLGVWEVKGCKLTPACIPADVDVSLITMGCPVEHLYRHYMPDRYSYSNRAREYVQSWLNVYRIDDFIGTRINGKNGDSENEFPMNHNIGTGGHTDYWCDPRVLDWVVPVLCGTNKK